MEFIILFVIQGVIFGAFSSFIAGQKGRDKINWFWLGFFFSILALLSLIAIPSIEIIKSTSFLSSPKKSTPIEAKIINRQCPYCAETIKAEAKICRYCQRDLPLLQKTKSAIINSKKMRNPFHIKKSIFQTMILKPVSLH